MSETIEKSLIESEGISLMTKIPRLLCISDSLIKLYESRLVAKVQGGFLMGILSFIV